jgi:hypothetical protein
MLYLYIGRNTITRNRLWRYSLIINELENVGLISVYIGRETTYIIYYTYIYVLKDIYKGVG